MLSDAKVSRHHAVIADDGRTILFTDLGSANGVRVRRKRIDPSAELHEGDRIRIGDEEFTPRNRSRLLVDVAGGRADVALRIQ